VTVVAGSVAAIGSGLLTAFKFDDKARRRFAQERRYKSVVDDAKNAYARLSGRDPVPDEAAPELERLQRILDEIRNSAEP